MNKTVKTILCVVAAVTAVAAAVLVILNYRNEIADLLGKMKEKLTGKSEFTVEEYEDFADI